MKLHNPLFIPYALLLAGCLAVANHNGWSLIQSIARHTWQHGYPRTQHK